jgi:hypothetical protein
MGSGTAAFTAFFRYALPAVRFPSPSGVRREIAASLAGPF